MEKGLKSWIRFGRRLNVIPANITMENRDEVIDWVKLYFKVKK